MFLFQVLKHMGPLPLQVSTRVAGGVVSVLCFVLYYPLVTQSLQSSKGAALVLEAMTGTPPIASLSPFYSWCARGLVLLFPANPVQCLALFSAFCQACAAGLLVYLGSLWQVPIPLAVATALSWGLGSAAMSAAVVVEVTGLQSMLVVGLLIAATHLALAGRWAPISLVALGLCFGLGLSTHHTMVLWLPLVLPLMVAQASVQGMLARVKAVLYLGAGILCGLLPFAFLLPGEDLSLHESASMRGGISGGNFLYLLGGGDPPLLVCTALLAISLPEETKNHCIVAPVRLPYSPLVSEARRGFFCHNAEFSK